MRRKTAGKSRINPGKAPAWLTRRLLKWKRLFGLEHWSWRVHWVSSGYLNRGGEHKEGGPVTYGRCEPLVPYLSARLYFSRTLRNNAWGRVVAFHEARHAYYAAHLTHALSRDIIERYVPRRERKHVYRELEDIVETLIEMDTIQFEQLVDF